eukprot:CAMPEP_0178908920 /NCGR_PEP_ID=MMETSP0786-20121207/8195_1 /TAXON_ID=186022 /ORGANISM="Thalassionema frauenfeldii, Strain CCMP 1798" /LENGTH=891 /DNA_ID=CAMNT_0020580885 /DNA_START=222 /DNA_END=2897 /DNA_ORIENTATION=+
MNKQEIAALADAEEKELAFLKSEQELERKLLGQRQVAENKEEEERLLAEVQREEGLEKLEAKERKLHQLQLSYDMTSSFRRQIQLKRDNFQELTKKRFDREEVERKQLRMAQLRARENIAATQDLVASHKPENEKKTYMKECKLAAQQMSELQRRESEQFHELQSLKNKMNQEVFDDETRAMEKRHSEVTKQRIELENLQAKHHQEICEERRRAQKTKQEMDAMLLKRQQQQELRNLAIQHEMRLEELQQKLYRSSQEKRDRHARQMKEELNEFQEQLHNLESGSYGTGTNSGSHRTISSSSNKGSSYSHSEVGDDNAEKSEKSDMRKKLEAEEKLKRRALVEKKEKEEDALFKTQEVLTQQRIEENDQRLDALKKQHSVTENQLIKRHEELIKEFDTSVLNQARDKVDEHEKHMLKVRMAHAKERQDISNSHQRELEAFKKGEALNQQLRQNAIEAANSASKTKGDFLAFVCHELRNPLHGMVAIVDLIVEDETIQIPEVKKHLVHLRQQTDLMSEIVNDVLDLSKIESGKLDLSFVDFNIIQLIKSMTLDQELIIQKMEKNVKVEAIISNNVPETIWADPVRWRQILLNILSNACKFTKEGYIKIEVSVLPPKEDGAAVLLAKGQYNEARGDAQTMMIKVVDSGIGISEDELPRLFKAFSQAQPHVAREYGGTGIGLSISKALTDQMKGTIGVQSKIGEGSTFTFTLPFQTGDNTNVVELSSLQKALAASEKKKVKRVSIAEGNPVEEGETKPQSNLQKIKGRTLLIVDDIQLNRELAATRFGKAGVNVVLASTGKDLLDKVIPTINADGISSFDAILTDVNMPIMRGDEATRVLRSHGYKGVIIGLTGSGTEGERKVYLEAGMTTVLVKPYRFEELAGTIIECLAQKE